MKAKIRASLCLYALSLLLGFAAMGDSADISPLPANNCAFNALITAILLLDPHAEETAVAALQAMNIEGPLKAFSLLDLGRALQKQNYSVTAYQDVKCEDISGILDSKDKVGILYLKGLNEIGHFIVLRKNDGQYKIYDYPYQAQNIAPEAMEERLGKVFTGCLLSLTIYGSAKQDSHTIDTSSLSLSAAPITPYIVKTAAAPKPLSGSKTGRLLFSPEVLVARSLVEPDVLEGVLTLTNQNKRPVLVHNIRGACSCYIGAIFDNLPLAAGESKDIKLRFKANAFNFARGTSVALETVDSANQGDLEEVKIRADNSDHAPIPILYPRSIYFSQKVGSYAKRKFFLLIPKNVSIYNFKDIQFDKKDLAVTLVKSFDVTLYLKQYRAMEYSVENKMQQVEPQTINVELNTATLPVAVKGFDNYL